MHTTWNALFNRFASINLQTCNLQARKSASNIVEPYIRPVCEAQDKEVFAVEDAYRTHFASVAIECIYITKRKDE